MYCRQPAARRLGPADQAEPTASSPVVSSLTLASAETGEACREGQYGLRSGRPRLRSSGHLPGNPAQLGMQGENKELLESIKWASQAGLSDSFGLDQPIPD